MNFHYAWKNVFFPHFLFVTLFSQGWLAWLAIFILPPIFSRFRLAGSTKHKTSSLTIRKTWNLRQKLLQPSAKKGFSTCIKIVVSNGWWKKQSAAVPAACQSFAILAAKSTGRKNKSLLPPRIYSWSYYQSFYVKYSSFVFSHPRCLSESWAVTRISQLFPRRQ